MRCSLKLSFTCHVGHVKAILFLGKVDFHTKIDARFKNVDYILCHRIFYLISYII